MKGDEMSESGLAGVGRPTVCAPGHVIAFVSVVKLPSASVRKCTELND